MTTLDGHARDEAGLLRAEHPGTVGQFAWNTTTGQWRWDAGMFQMHGYRPGSFEVDSDLVLAHKQEEHRDRAAAMMRAAASEDQRYSNYHDIVDAEGRRRTVLTVGVSRLESSRAAARRISRGFMVDVTQDANDRTGEVVARVRQSMAPIAQSIGLLMGSLGLPEDAAFEVMSRVSQHHKVKLRLLAERFMATAVATAAGSPRDLLQVLVDEAMTIAAARALEAD